MNRNEKLLYSIACVVSRETMIKDPIYYMDSCITILGCTLQFLLSDPSITFYHFLWILLPNQTKIIGEFPFFFYSRSYSNIIIGRKKNGIHLDILYKTKFHKWHIFFQECIMNPFPFVFDANSNLRQISNILFLFSLRSVLMSLFIGLKYIHIHKYG